jgi:hypothetical protein
MKRRFRYRHRLAAANPRAALVSEILIVKIEGEWWMHIYARGVRAGCLRVPPILGAEFLNALMPAGVRTEVEIE